MVSLRLIRVRTVPPLCFPHWLIMSTGNASPSVSLRKDGILKGHRSRVFDLRWSPTQPARIASVGEAGGYIWSVEGAARTVSFPGTELMRVCWHPDGEHVLTGSAQGKIVVHAADGQAAATLDASSEDEVYGIEVLPRPSPSPSLSLALALTLWPQPSSPGPLSLASAPTPSLTRCSRAKGCSPPERETQYSSGTSTAQ